MGRDKAQTFPNIWNVPHFRNLSFTGRVDLLTELEQTNTAAITQAIAGLGGVGKTQLATEYAYRHAANFALVWWVRAEQELSLRADLAGLAAALGLEEAQAQEQQVAIDAAVRWLESKGTRWLLVFDNVNFPNEVKPYLPQGGDGKVIVTSRYNGDWLGVAKPMQVRVWCKGEAVEFLLKRTNKDEPQAGEELAAELDCLPLALEQAAAYICETGIAILDYLNLYREYHLEVLEEAKSSQNYHEDTARGKEQDTVATTWKLAFANLPEEAQQFMTLCAFLAPDEIPMSLFRNNTVELPKPLKEVVENALKLNRLKTALKNYSLAEVGNEVVTVHRLVQAVGREQLGEEQRKEWAGTAVLLVSAALTTNVQTDIASWEVYAQLQWHALAAASVAERLEVEAKTTGRLLNQVASYLYGRADYATALVLFKRALTIAQKTDVPESELVTIYTNNLGQVLQALGDYQGAKILYEQASPLMKSSLASTIPTLPEMSIT